MSEKINIHTKADDLTIGGNIYEAGNARNFKTGDWRSQKPIYISEKCKQCGLCFPVCPDDAITVEEQKRKDFNYDYCKGCRSLRKSLPIWSNRNERRGGKLIWELENV